MINYFVAEVDLRDGKSINLPEMPKELQILRYREKFHLSWEQFKNTPIRIFYSDLAILSLEADVLKSKQNATTRKQ